VPRFSKVLGMNMGPLYLRRVALEIAGSIALMVAGSRLQPGRLVGASE